ncbi:MAG: STAS domain-containing protein [Planctomycetes bacterium]|nr:STAS domain-containing protein [Planctomycetota bacterium]
MRETSLFSGKLKDKLVLRVVGKGKSSHSAALSQAADEAVENGVSSIVIDLKSCDWLDSTFVGTLVGIALRLRNAHRGHLALANVDEATRRQLEEFGLTRLLALEEVGEDYHWAVSRLPDVLQEPSQLARAILEAHQHLMKVNPENARRFAALQRRLLVELQAALPDRPPSELAST